MSRFILVVAVVAGAGGGAAIPAPQEPTAQALVAKLSAPSEDVRNEASAALKGRADALPWLRRAARSKVPITSARAAKLLEPNEKKRQQLVAKAIDICLRDGCVDQLTEWHLFWQPEKKNDLWSVGPRAAKPGTDLLAKWCRPDIWKALDKELASLDDADPESCNSHDGPCPARFKDADGPWNIRTDRLFHPPSFVRFASVGDRAYIGSTTGYGRFLILGRVGTSTLRGAFVACDGDVRHQILSREKKVIDLGVTTESSVVVCRGNFVAATTVSDSVLLVDGDIDLTGSRPKNCLIRATGEIRLPKGFAPEACKIEAHTKNATAPYKFFELTDVGLSLADDEEGLIVTAVKPGTPLGDCGIRKGDLVRAVDDVPAIDSEDCRRKLRKAMVRQGDCLLTVVRDGPIDLPVFFPDPK